MATVELFYDIGSPYSYLACTQIEGIAADCGATVTWRPMLLGGVFKLTGNTMPAALPSRARYMIRDLSRWGRHYGVPIRVPDHFPANSLLAMRALTALPEDRVAAASLALFEAYWVRGEHLDEATVGAAVGPDALAAAGTQEVKDRLRLTTEEAVERGAFGAPTMFVAGEMFFGNDRLPFVEQKLRSPG